MKFLAEDTIFIGKPARFLAEPQPNPYIGSEFTEGNEGPGRKLRLFVSFVTFCKNSEL